MKYKKILIFSIGLVFSLFLTKTNVNAAPSNIIDNVNQTGVTLVRPGQEQKVEVNGKYNFSMQLINGENKDTRTTYTPKGDTTFNGINRQTNAPYSDAFPNSKSKVYYFQMGKNTEQSVYVANVGFYQGRSIDVKWVIDDLYLQKKDSVFRFFAVDPSEQNIRNRLVPSNNRNAKWGDLFMSIGSGLSDRHTNIPNQSGNRGPFTKNDYIDYHYEFYDSETKERIDVVGIWNITNLNRLKTLNVYSPLNDLSKYYTYSNIGGNRNLIQYEVFPNMLQMSNNRTSSMNRYETSFTGLFEKTRDLRFHLDINSETMGLDYLRQAIPRVAPSIQTVIGRVNKATHTDSNYKDVYYDIIFSVGNNSYEKRSDKLSIETTAPVGYEVKPENVKVYNIAENDEEVDTKISYDVISDTSDSSKATVIFKDTKSEDFNNGQYKISVIATPNDSFDLSKNGYLVKDGDEFNGYMHFDLATTAVMTYTHYESNHIDAKQYSHKVDERSIAKTNYEGKPIGKAKQNVPLEYGKSILSQYPDASELLEEGYQTAIDTNNISKDTPVTADYVDKNKLPDTTNLYPNTIVKVPIRLTSKLGVTTDVYATLLIKATHSQLTVNIVNEADKLLEKVELKDYLINQKIDLTNIKEVTSTLEKYTSNGGYTIIKRPENETNLLLDAPKMSVTYKLKGNLLIESAPNLFDYGDIKTSVDDIYVKQAKNLDKQPPLKIVDNRSNKSTGWNLKLKMIKAFTNDGTELSNIMEYRLSDSDRFIVTSDAMTAYHSKTGGDYTLNDDWKKYDSGLGLTIGPGQVKKLGRYSCEIEWDLMPGEEP